MHSCWLLAPITCALITKNQVKKSHITPEWVKDVRKYTSAEVFSDKD